MEVVKDEYVEISKEQKDVVEKQEVVQLAANEVAQHIEITEAKFQESNTPVEENEEAMLPEDGILLTYTEKQSWKNNEMEVGDNLIMPVTEVPEYSADIPMSRDNDEISKNSQKSQETKERIEDIAVTPSMSQPVIKSNEISVEGPIENEPVRMNMVDKLVKVVSNLGNKVKNEENLKIPAIDLMLRIQVALDEHNVFPENATVDILDIIMIQENLGFGRTWKRL